MDDLEDLARRTATPQNGFDPTRARPEPWFVGSSPRLMIVVVTVVALLIVVRFASMVWLIEDAWQW